MKHVYVCLVLVFICAKSISQPLIAGAFSLSGTVKVPYTGKVFLTYFDYLQNKSISDSSPLLNQRYTFKGYFKEPVTATLYFTTTDTSKANQMNSVYFLLLEPGSIKVETGKYMSEMKVSGSTTYNEYVAFQQKDRKYLQKIDSCRFYVSQFQKKKDSIQVAKYNSGILQIQQEQLENLYRKEVLLKKNSMFSLFILQRMLQMKYDKIQLNLLFQQLALRIKNTAAAKNLKLRFK
jgi:hypothetical protein